MNILLLVHETIALANTSKSAYSQFTRSQEAAFCDNNHSSRYFDVDRNHHPAHDRNNQKHGDEEQRKSWGGGG